MHEYFIYITYTLPPPLTIPNYKGYQGTLLGFFVSSVKVFKNGVRNSRKLLLNFKRKNMGQESCKTSAAALRKGTEEKREVMPFQLSQRSVKLRVRRCAGR